MAYRFADCTLDPDRRELLRGDAEQRVEPQVFDLLVLLVAEAGRALSKDEIVERIWNGRAISDDAITSRIKAARRAIGDDGTAQRLIRTLPRVGYRFVGEVVETAGEREDAPAPAAPVARAGGTDDALGAEAQEEPEIGYLTDRRGRSIGYAVRGKGPLVILPPFWVTAADLWHDHLDPRAFYISLGEGVRLLRYDRPGAGLSRGAAPNASLEDEVALLEDVIAHAGAERVSLLAISAAGTAAIRYAAAHPERVERVCFYGAYASGRDLAPPEAQGMLLGLILQHWGVGSRALADIFVPSADAEGRRRFAAQQRAAAEPEAAAAMLRLSWDLDASESLGDVRAPTLVLHRKDDRAVPVEHGRRLAQAIAGARLQVLPGDAHAPWFGALDMARRANAFLRGEA